MTTAIAWKARHHSISLFEVCYCRASSYHCASALVRGDAGEWGANDAFLDHETGVA